MLFGKKASGEIEITSVSAPATTALILICEKCGKKVASSSTPENPSRDLQQALKSKIKDAGGKGKLRAVVSSCFDICPKGEIAIAIIHEAGPTKETEYLTLKNAEHAIDQTAVFLLETIAKRTTNR